MASLRERHLPDRVDHTLLLGEGAEGETWADPAFDRPAYVEQSSKLVVDRRSTSPTAGQEIAASMFVVLLLKDDVLPRTKITVYKGTPREHTGEVIESRLYKYPRTPSHVEVWTD